MISALTGTIVAHDGRSVDLDVHGVTFHLFVVPRAIEGWPLQSTQTIATYLHVREDALELFGFIDTRERKLFERLLTVSGVGPRLALSVLSAGSVNDLEAAIDRGDATLLMKVSGVGTKTAQRIVLDLRGKLVDDMSGDTALSSTIDALVHLGYSSREAREAARETSTELRVEDRVRAALKRLGRKT
jgi:Holliday junction DNA helicase RuvA